MKRALALALLLAACKKDAEQARVVEPAPIPERALFPKNGLFSPHAYGMFALLLTGGDTVDKALKACPMEDFARVEFGEHSDEAPAVSWKRVSFSELRAPPPEMLETAGVELSDTEKASVRGAAGWLMLAFSSPRARELAPRSAEALECLGRNAKALIFDHHTAQIFSAASWKKRRIDSTHAGVVEVPSHIIVDEQEDGELRRLVTSGMAKFALPDVVLEKVSRSYTTPMVGVINLVSQTLVERGAIDDNGRLTIEIATLRHAKMRADYQGELMGKPEGRALLDVGVGERKDDDPKNRLLEIRFLDRKSSPPQQHHALLRKLFGAPSDPAMDEKHDARLLAVSAAAKKKLAALKPRFDKGLATKERLVVKAPFKTESGGNEWMWVEVTSWNGDRIRGILVNEPVEVTGLRVGATVEVSQSSLFDYLYYKADGTTEGNETAKLLQGAR